jgi:hypothetical protein
MTDQRSRKFKIKRLILKKKKIDQETELNKNLLSSMVELYSSKILILVRIQKKVLIIYLIAHDSNYPLTVSSRWKDL